MTGLAILKSTPIRSLCDSVTGAEWATGRSPPGLSQALECSSNDLVNAAQRSPAKSL